MDFYEEDKAALQGILAARQTRDAVKKAIFIAASTIPEISVAHLDQMLNIVDKLAADGEPRRD